VGVFGEYLGSQDRVEGKKATWLSDEASSLAPLRIIRSSEKVRRGSSEWEKEITSRDDNRTVDRTRGEIQRGRKRPVQHTSQYLPYQNKEGKRASSTLPESYAFHRWKNRTFTNHNQEERERNFWVPDQLEGSIKLSFVLSTRPRHDVSCRKNLSEI